MAILVILLEHDIGFSLLLFVMFITMLWVATGRWTYVVGGLVAFVAGTFLAAHLPFARSLIDQRVSAGSTPGPTTAPTVTRPSKASSLSAEAALPDQGSVSALPTTSPSPTATSSSPP